jgi:hypothetical protein
MADADNIDVPESPSPTPSTAAIPVTVDNLLHTFQLAQVKILA